MKKLFTIKTNFSLIVCLVLLIINPLSARALELGTLLYRTSGEGLMYGYSSRDLLGIKKGILQHIYPGHVGIYIGQEDGVHYVVEALAGGVLKTRAEHFVNEAAGEKFIGAKLPKEASFSQKLKAVKIAKSLANKNLDYDFNFQKQKGPNSGDWTCVGLVEKIYESANILNPNNLESLVYDSDDYALDITPDGFDNSSFFNEEGDSFSTKREFSKITARKNLILPLPEKIGYNAGRLYKGERYFFLPYTQYLQSTLKDQKVDIEISSSFKEKEIRGKTPTLSLMLRWSLVNNPLSSLKTIADKTVKTARKVVAKLKGSDDPSISLDAFDLLEDDKINANKPEVVYEAIMSKSGNEEINENINPPKLNEDIANDDDKESLILENKIIVKKNDKEIVDNIKNDTVANASQKNKQTQDQIEEKLTININKKNNATETKNEDKNIKEEVKIKKQDIINNNSQNKEPKTQKPSPLSLKLADSKIKQGTKPDEARSLEEQKNINPSQGTPSAYISKVYSTGMNDFIELYNPNDFAFDLAEAGFRIEKTKTADNPSIAIRIGNETDGIYPKGTMIKAKGYYLIVRDGASPYFLNLADAIAKRSEFGWTGNGYTLYLGKGAISSSIDSDIIDAIGYGEAIYFRGSEPALEIPDNYYLNRVGFANDNFSDFVLAASSDPAISWDDYIEDESEDESEDIGSESGDDLINEDNNEDNNENNNDSTSYDDFSPYNPFDTIEASSISELWHFDECYGDYGYNVGIFDCGLQLSHNTADFSELLDPEINLNQFSVSFYYRDNSFYAMNRPRIKLRLSNDSKQYIEILLEKNLLQIENLPNSQWRYKNKPIFSTENYNWRHFSLTINKDEGYWAAYVNGEEMCRHEFIESLPSNITKIEIVNDTGIVALDELVLWSKSLSQEDINTIIDASAPFEPYPKRSAQKYPVLKYYWDFNEGHEKINEGGGTQAIDEIKELIIDLPENSWAWRDTNNTGIINKFSNELSVDLPQVIDSQDMSLAFWWRSSFYPKDGRSQIGLFYDNEAQFALTPSYYRRKYWYNNMEGVFSEGEDIDFTKDENWHHFIITYDSYRYKLTLYVDGQEKRSLPHIWLEKNKLPNRLVIHNELNSVEIDDLLIFEGALSATQAAKLYQGTLIDNF